MFFFNSPVVNVDPGALTNARAIIHPHHFLWHGFDSVLFKWNSSTGGAGAASEQRRIISRIKVFPFPLHLGFSNYGGEISLRTLSPADKHACTHRQTGTHTSKHEHAQTHTHTNVNANTSNRHTYVHVTSGFTIIADLVSCYIVNEDTFQNWCYFIRKPRRTIK